MSRHIRAKQTRDHHQHNAYEVLQDAIYAQTGIHCTVLVKPEVVSIRTADYTEFILARAVVSKMSGLPIIRAAN